MRPVRSRTTHSPAGPPEPRHSSPSGKSSSSALTSCAYKAPESPYQSRSPPGSAEEYPRVPPAKPAPRGRASVCSNAQTSASRSAESLASSQPMFSCPAPWRRWPGALRSPAPHPNPGTASSQSPELPGGSPSPDRPAQPSTRAQSPEDVAWCSGYASATASDPGCCAMPVTAGPDLPAAPIGRAASAPPKRDLVSIDFQELTGGSPALPDPAP